MPETGSVTADDLDRAVQLALTALRAAPPSAWTANAGSLDWDCWETAEHLSEDYLAYAARLGPRRPPMDARIPFRRDRHRPGAPLSAVHADRDAGIPGLLQVLEACGALLVAMVRVTPPDVRAQHGWGASDAEGFAAMGIVETFAHTHDLAQGLGISWTPPDDLCAKALARLFPDVPTGTPPWPTLLWATGRGDLPGRPRRTEWRWYGSPVTDRP